MQGEHYFVSISEMNDPFDCNPVYEKSPAGEIYKFYKGLGRKYIVDSDKAKERLPNGKLGKKLLKEKMTVSFENIRRALPILHSHHERMRNEHRIVCFSENWDNPLMWAHYSNSHKGVVLNFELDPDAIAIAGDDPPLDIEYSDKRLQISTIDILTWMSRKSKKLTAAQRKQGDDAFLAYVLHKSNHWSYECEWRLQKPARCGNGYESSSCLSLKEVTLGARISREDETLVREIVGEKVHLSRCILDPNSFSLSKVAA